MMTGYEIARLFQFVRETAGQNRGLWVSLFQKYCDGKPGDSWCSDFRSFVRAIQYQGEYPELKTGSCTDALAHARRHGWIAADGWPCEDDTFYCLNADGLTAHHTGIVGRVAPDGRFATAEGNSNDDGSSNGDRVAIRGLDHPKVRRVSTGHYAFVRPPRPAAGAAALTLDKAAQ